MSVPSENIKERLAQLLEAALSKCKQNDQLDTLTDLYFQLDEENLSLSVFDDEEQLLASIEVKELSVATGHGSEKLVALLQEMVDDHDLMEKFEEYNLLKPFSLLIVDAQFDHVSEVYLLESGEVVIEDSLFKNIDKELDDFLDKLLKE